MRRDLYSVNRYTASVVATLLAIGLAACGGGGGNGGDGGDGGGSSGISYEGVATPAAVDSSNSAPISVAAATTAVTSNAGIVAKEGSQQRPAAGAAVIGQVVVDILHARTTSRVSARALALTDVDEKLSGSCGGSVFTKGTVDEQTGDFSLKLDFNRYCDAGFTIYGQVDASGRVTGLSSADITMTGNRLIFSDSADKRTFMWENFTFTYDVSGSTQSYTVEGIFSHPDYGYVNVTTLSMLQIFGSDMFPSAGSITIVEDNADPDSATLTTIDSSQYRIDIDYGNDASIDETITGNWNTGPVVPDGEPSNLLVGTWAVTNIENIPASVGGPSGVTAQNSTWIFGADGSHEWFFSFDRTPYFFDVMAVGSYSLNGSTLTAQGMSDAITSRDTIFLTYTNNNQSFSFLDDEGDRWTYVKTQ